MTGSVPTRLGKFGRLMPSDFQAAALWGVTAGTAGIYLVQPFDWIKKTFFEKPEADK